MLKKLALKVWGGSDNWAATSLACKAAAISHVIICGFIRDDHSREARQMREFQGCAGQIKNSRQEQPNNLTMRFSLNMLSAAYTRVILWNSN